MLPLQIVDLISTDIRISQLRCHILYKILERKLNTGLSGSLYISKEV